MSVTVMAKLGVDTASMDVGLAQAKGKMDRATRDMQQSASKAALEPEVFSAVQSASLQVLAQVYSQSTKWQDSQKG